MRRTWVAWAKPLSGGLVLLLGLTFAAPPVAASEPEAATSTLAVSAAAKVAATPVAARVLAQAAPSPAAAGENGRSFFKRPKGIATLVLMAVGTGYMIRSAFKDNDPVHSQFR